jgi:hypothetical protein
MPKKPKKPEKRKKSRKRARKGKGLLCKKCCKSWRVGPDCTLAVLDVSHDPCAALAAITYAQAVEMFRPGTGDTIARIAHESLSKFPPHMLSELRQHMYQVTTAQWRLYQIQQLAGMARNDPSGKPN